MALVPGIPHTLLFAWRKTWTVEKDMDSYNSWRRLALFAMSCATAMAQVDTGTISGIVTDSSGAIVPGA